MANPQNPPYHIIYPYKFYPVMETYQAGLFMRADNVKFTEHTPSWERPTEEVLNDNTPE